MVFAFLFAEVEGAWKKDDSNERDEVSNTRGLAGDLLFFVSFSSSLCLWSSVREKSVLDSAGGEEISNLITDSESANY